MTRPDGGPRSNVGVAGSNAGHEAIVAFPSQPGWDYADLAAEWAETRSLKTATPSL